MASLMDAIKSIISTKIQNFPKTIVNWWNQSVGHKIYVTALCTLILGILIPGPIGSSVIFMSIGMFITALVWYE